MLSVVAFASKANSLSMVMVVTKLAVLLIRQMLCDPIALALSGLLAMPGHPL